MIFKNLISKIIQWRIVLMVLLGLAMLTGAFLTKSNLKIDNSVSIWFLDDNPDYRSYLGFQQERGSDEIIIAMIPASENFDAEHVHHLQILHDSLAELSTVTATLSIANAKYPIYSRNKIYYRNIYTEGKDPQLIMDLLDDLPTLKKQLLDLDNGHNFFYIQLNPTDEIEGARNQIVEEVRSKVEAQFPEAIISGQPILNEAFNDTIFRESTVFAILTVVLIMFLLILLLPSWTYLPIAMISVGVPISILMGIMTSMGYSLNLISMLIPTILMVYSVSDVVHILNIFHNYRIQFPEEARNQQIQQALYQSLKPCFYTTLTTIIGYLALYLSPLPAFKIMGVFTFLGLLLSFVLVYIIAAVGLSYLPRVFKEKRLRNFQVQGLIRGINYLGSHRSSLVLGIGGLLLLVSCFLLPKIEVNTDSLNLLGEGAAKEDLFAIEEALGGNARCQINLIRRDSGTFLERGALNKLEALQTKIQDYELLANPISLVDFKNFMEDRLPPFSNPSPSRLGLALNESKGSANQFFTLATEDWSEVSIAANLKELQTKELEVLLAQIESDFQETFGEEDYEVEVQGFLALFAQLNQFILHTQFRSFGVAFLLAFGILFYFIGDFKTSLLALIPNLLPLGLTIIVMYAFSIDLEASNAMLAPIMLGVAMDDTIHLMNKFQFFRKQGLSVEASMDQALAFTGGALFSTTIALVGGFLIVGLSGVASVSTFGLLCAFTILAALLADVIVLPALIKRYA